MLLITAVSDKYIQVNSLNTDPCFLFSFLRFKGKAIVQMSLLN